MDSVVVGQPLSALTVSLLSKRQVSCHGESTGVINATAAGGTAPYPPADLKCSVCFFDWSSKISIRIQWRVPQLPCAEHFQRANLHSANNRPQSVFYFVEVVITQNDGTYTN